MTRVLAITVLLLLAGCGGKGVKGATGDTPVKYVICGPGEANCFVAARFKDLDSCHSHKDWADMRCDKRTTPGVMICRKDTGTTIAVAYCTL